MEFKNRYSVYKYINGINTFMIYIYRVNIYRFCAFISLFL